MGPEVCETNLTQMMDSIIVYLMFRLGERWGFQSI